MPGEHRDHSGTPLWRKLGIAEGSRVHVAGAPAGFERTLTALGPLPAGVTLLARPGRDLDVVVVFATRRDDLARRFPRLAAAIGRAGGIWVAWPKKASKVATDLDFDAVQATGLAAGLVDNKSCSVDDVFQALRFVRRRADREPA
ncbi:MAG: DUF3052 domain-containing protein [Planctomycetaceae bacterium]